MTNSRTIKAKSPADLLAIVPCVLGFHPEESLVLLTLGGAEDRCHARVDLPEEPDDVDVVVDQLSEVVRRNGANRCVLVAYSDDQCAAQELTDRLTRQLAEAGADVVEAIRADGERWYTLTGCTGPCCPLEGTPYDVASHPVTAQAVVDGQVTLGSRRELAGSLIGADPDALVAVETAADEAMDRFLAAARHPLGPPAPEAARAHLIQEGQWVGERVRRFLADGEALDHTDAGRMVVALVMIELRDVAWAEMTRANAPRHVDLWRDVLRRTPYDLVAAPAALLGFAAWLAGDGALAWCAVDRCQEVEPDYRLASLLTDALAGAVPPSRWEPVGKESLTRFAS
ncbi:MAG TPA: DUF4192 domain-containing protein [Nocardioidaceae bacterium]|nr:DUF4192 domain-containing protein [Nocardioidaceae bacterium]